MIRQGFGLPQALLIILFIGGIVTVTMRYASMGTKHYADSYLREQAELFLHTSTEATLLQLSGYERNQTGNDECLEQLTITSADKKFTANVHINRYYLPEGQCTGDSGNTISTLIGTTSEYDKPSAMIDMTVIVESNNTNPQILHPIRLERRSLQRP